MSSVWVYFRGERTGERVDRKARGVFRKYEDGHGTDLRTGTEDYSFSGPCTAMQKVARAFKAMKGVRVKLYEGGEPVKKLVCKRRSRR